MPAQSKIDMLEKVSASLEASAGLFVIDYRGLTVKETQELRRGLREAGAHMKVYKNNLVRIALEKAEMPAIDDCLEGTVACVFYDSDPAAAAKVIKETSKKLNKIEFRGGITDGQVVSAEALQGAAPRPDRRSHQWLRPRHRRVRQWCFLRSRPLDPAGFRAEGRLAAALRLVRELGARPRVEPRRISCPCA